MERTIPMSSRNTPRVLVCWSLTTIDGPFRRSTWCICTRTPAAVMAPPKAAECVDWRMDWCHKQRPQLAASGVDPQRKKWVMSGASINSRALRNQCSLELHALVTDALVGCNCGFLPCRQWNLFVFLMLKHSRWHMVGVKQIFALAYYTCDKWELTISIQ